MMLYDYDAVRCRIMPCILHCAVWYCFSYYNYNVSFYFQLDRESFQMITGMKTIRTEVVDCMN